MGGLVINSLHCIIQKRVSNQFVYYYQNYCGVERWNGLKDNATPILRKDAEGLVERLKRQSPQDDYMILGK